MIELLVVVAIIGVLATIVLSSLGQARERARVTKVVAEIRQIETNIFMYYLDTNTFPRCIVGTCNTASQDPFLNPLGVSGWNGPYGKGQYNRKHPWGGMFTTSFYDYDGDGRIEPSVFLDEDAPGTNASDNSGPIPQSALLKLDQQLDDGSLATGRFRAGSAAGEAGFYFDGFN